MPADQTGEIQPPSATPEEEFLKAQAEFDLFVPILIVF
jgi:hypothetical protein